MQEFIGRFHPLFVHLPIGILSLAVLFEWLPARKSFKSLRKSIRFMLWIGFLSALASGLTGYLLSQSGDYESDSVQWHQFGGIAVSIFSFAYAWVRGQKQLKPVYKLCSVIMLGLLTVTGHLGGTLTHGENYLTAGWSAPKEKDLSTVNLQQAHYYDDLVKPILEAKCYTCHSSAKQKGKLRLDEPEHILKGGKKGAVIVAGKAGESEMINRILLPLADDDHMPPKEKKQLSEKEIALLRNWIAAGADFKKSVTETGQLAEVEKILSAEQRVQVSDVPEKEIAPADDKVLQELRKMGVVILPVAANSNYLSANLINAIALDSALDLLKTLQPQLVWLKAGNQLITDNQLTKIATLTSLTRLALERTQLTDQGIGSLVTLKTLHYLNLNHTKITVAGLAALAPLKELQTIYLYGTNINQASVLNLQKSFPTTVLEVGNYVVPALPTDTVEVKPGIVPK